MNLKKRVEALEAMLSEDHAILYFADSSPREISGPRGFMAKLLFAACGGPDGTSNVTPRQAEHLELIGRIIGSQESGGGQLVNLIRCMLEGTKIVLKVIPFVGLVPADLGGHII
jgi:hypothetical protein